MVRMNILNVYLTPAGQNITVAIGYDRILAGVMLISHSQFATTALMLN